MAIGRTVELDGKLCFDLWSELDSTGKVSRRLGINPNTGKPYTRMAIWRAARVWVLENPTEETRKTIADDDAKRKMDPMDDDKWQEYLVQSAEKVWGGKKGPMRLEEWLTENDLHNVYKRLFG